MSLTDPIADMASLIKNAGDAGKEKVDIKASKVNEEILKILKSESFIQTFKRIEDDKQGILRVYLKYDDEKSPVIKSIRRISKPGLKIYKKKTEIVPVLGGLGINIISTSKGILSDKEVRERGLGGEIILEVW